MVFSSTVPYIIERPTASVMKRENAGVLVSVLSVTLSPTYFQRYVDP
ncbi:MAG: hypothetical protein IPP90_02210 [Gemmatimonadaceae bacterium]|nr:hypothetical protein [Gemmatimonadaceae bacterium]